MKKEEAQYDPKYRPEWRWNGRSLDNYKDMHRGTAREKGREAEFLSARTLTQARKIAFGTKAKQKGR